MLKTKKIIVILLSLKLVLTTINSFLSPETL